MGAMILYPEELKERHWEYLVNGMSKKCEGKGCKKKEKPKEKKGTCKKGPMSVPDGCSCTVK